MRHTTLFAGFYLLMFISNAQSSWRKPSSNGISSKKSYIRNEKLPFYFILRGGLTQFFGELNEQDMRAMTGISLGKSFNKNLAIQLDYTAGKVGGEKIQFFNSYFINEYNTIECIVKWNLTEQFNRLEPGPVNLFLYGGIGQIHFNANAFDIDTDKILRFTNSQLSARNPLFLRWGPAKGPIGIKRTREGILPLGTSMNYEMFPHLRIGLDYRFYLVRTDKMDATSGARLINPEESTSYSDTPDDKFSFLAIFLTYRFGMSK
ncbi:hypothetical protein [Dyadobacter arcticus]|uniref:Outer membrane protein beta-barrel domain-containing protein n=1 Tax=Dyadobacter arcticus TaxID=1078754 RepID=A0ABX0UV25_9BACT|nr:hypothetical protein [Dyadobacter arcticus]NIJ55665.1 hypothetical protein [Dyadobacter arcticus]